MLKSWNLQSRISKRGELILESLSAVFAQSANSIKTLILSKNNLTNDELIDSADILADCTGKFEKLYKGEFKTQNFQISQRTRSSRCRQQPWADSCFNSKSAGNCSNANSTAYIEPYKTGRYRWKFETKTQILKLDLLNISVNQK